MIRYSLIEPSYTKYLLDFVFEQMKNCSVLYNIDIFNIEEQKSIFMDCYLPKGLNGNLNFIAAFDNDLLVGTLGYIDNYIAMLYVDKDYQKRSIGLNLLNKYISIMKCKGVSTVTLASSKEATNFYKKHGFKEIKGKSRFLKMELTI